MLKSFMKVFVEITRVFWRFLIQLITLSKFLCGQHLRFVVHFIMMDTLLKNL